jgi:probable rRNA maturation factor
MSEKQSSKVQFHFLSPVPNLKNRTALKTFLLSTLKTKHRRVGAVNFIFCSDDYLLNINKQFLNHHYYTDIITFDLTEGADLVAEIYISVDRVKDNASSFNTSFINELHRVIFHGVLHLCGLKDKTPKESLEMRAAEQRILNKYFK